ncbi:MAG: class I SAM-dependent methyltransferase [Flavitalea sp.]
MNSSEEVYSEERMRDMGQQLGHPSGNAGIEMAVVMNETNIGMTKSAIAALQIQNNWSIAEAGHGNCGHLDYLLSQAADLRYSGLEISETMYNEAKHLNKDAVAKGRAKFYLYDGEKIPLPENSVDGIFTVNTIYFWKDRIALLNEFARVLKPGGKLAIGFAQKSFMEMLPFTKWNFNLVSTEDVLQLISQSELEPVDVSNHVESVKTKAGDNVDREYSVVVCKRKK